MCLEDEAKSHTDRVESGQPVCYRESCPECKSQQRFRRHDCRRRTFRLVVDGCVKVLASWIVRWKCPACGKRFTDYPPFWLAAQAFCAFACAGKGEGLLRIRPLLPLGGAADGEIDRV
jgi:hypothetical protein